MDIRLIVTDLDGTLLMPDGTVSERTRRALLACEKRGIPVVFASGRTFESLSGLARTLGLNSPIISANGARVDLSPSGPAILEDYLPEQLADEVLKILIASEMYVECYSGNAIYFLHPEKSPFPGWPGSRESVTIEGIRQRFVVGEDAMIREAGHRAYKFAVCSRNAAALDRVRQQLLPLNAALNSAFPFNIEIMEKGRGKGRALKVLTEHLGLSKDQVMAFGDGSNDLEMLQEAGVSVAMENGFDELKRCVSLIAPDNAHEGEAYIIEQMVLGNV
ncbi:MAG: HAD family phosphatase [Clostridia bacterium]|nr:HAD family phosphatase [Clostridia bacterium]